MTEPGQTLREDIAFLRGLADDSGRSLERDGAILIGVGLIFGVVDLVYWLMFAGLLQAPRPLGAWLWVAGLVLFFTALPVATRKMPRPTGATARAESTALGGVGIALAAAGVGLLLGAWRLGQMELVLWIFPIVLFTLYGAGWSVAFAVERRGWYAWVATGCFAAAVATGALMGSPHEWLVLSIGLFVLVALPGLAILRRARQSR